MTSVAITSCTIAATGLERLTFAIVALVIAVAFFLREVHLAMQTVRIALHEGSKRPPSKP